MSKGVFIVSVLLISVLSITFLLANIQRGIPYFTDEDEGHHFNRIVNMVKSGDYNPHYFLKPSLHLYLRMPVVAVAFLWSVYNGHIRRVEQIKTGDPFGLNGYSFAMSHPGIVKWNRAFTAFLGIMTCIVVGLSVYNIVRSKWLSLFSAGILAVSPGFVDYATKIGVNAVCAFFVSLSCFLYVICIRRFSLLNLFTLGIVCGLAISTKYNIAPVFFLSLIACLIYQETSIYTYLIAFLSPVIGFFVGTPFALVEIPLFLDHVAYEIWHYHIAGHVGYTFNTFIEQAINYLSWILENGFGVSGIIFAFLGVFLSFHRLYWEKLLSISVVVLAYLAIMMSQKAGFSRNMILVFPTISIFIAFGIYMLGRLLFDNNKGKRIIFTSIAGIVVMLETLFRGINAYVGVLNMPEDTRVKAYHWLREFREKLPSNTEIAVGGNIWFIPQVYNIKGVSRIDERVAKPSKIYLSGFDYMVVGPAFQQDDEGELRLLHLERFFKGVDQVQRIVNNPTIRVYRFSDNAQDIPLAKDYETELDCSESSHCWVKSRKAFIPIDISKVKRSGKYGVVELEIMNLWAGQKALFELGKYRLHTAFRDSEIGKWIPLTLRIPFDILRKTQGLKVTITDVHSPKALKLGAEGRRLGIAIKKDILDVKQ